MLPLLVATIITTSVSNSSTGGLSAQAGLPAQAGNIVTSGGDVVNGSSYSSVSVQTYDNNEGGTSTVQIETDRNGQVNTQTVTKTIPPGGSADIYVATSTGSGSALVEVGSTVDASATSSRIGRLISGLFGSSTASSSFEVESAGFGLGIQLQAFFNSLLGFFRLW